jgi:RecB family exonuclease
MGKISYSQFSMWDKCPYTWKANYVDKAETFKGNIYTLFGSALHETIQAYLVCYYERTIKEADALPLEDILMYRMKESYKQSKKQHGDDFEVTKEDMAEFYQDGVNIIEEFLKRKSSYFSKKNTELVGIEMNLNYELPKDMRFVGYMDVVLHDKKTGRMRIIDIKTATMGWNKYMKADKNKTNQLLLYKHFMAKQLEISEDKIDVEYFILKRRLYENMMYPQKRIQSFSPASGKPSVNRVMTRLQEFIDECYDDKGKIIANEYEKCEKHKKCRMCKDLK